MNNTKLQEAIATIIWFFEDDYTDGERDWKDKQVQETAEKLTQLYEELATELIGENDEHSSFCDDVDICHHQYTNRLRQEQRQRLSEQLGTQDE